MCIQISECVEESVHVYMICRSEEESVKASSWLWIKRGDPGSTHATWTEAGPWSTLVGLMLKDPKHQMSFLDLFLYCMKIFTWFITRKHVEAVFDNLMFTCLSALLLSSHSSLCSSRWEERQNNLGPSDGGKRDHKTNLKTHYISTNPLVRCKQTL